MQYVTVNRIFLTSPKIYHIHSFFNACLMPTGVNTPFIVLEVRLCENFVTLHESLLVCSICYIAYVFKTHP